MFRLTIMNEARTRLYFHPNHYRQPEDRPRVAYRAAVIEAQGMRGGFGYPEPFDCLASRMRAVRRARRRLA